MEHVLHYACSFSTSHAAAESPPRKRWHLTASRGLRPDLQGTIVPETVATASTGDELLHMLNNNSIRCAERHNKTHIGSYRSLRPSDRRSSSQKETHRLQALHDPVELIVKTCIGQLPYAHRGWACAFTRSLGHPRVIPPKLCYRAWSAT